MRFQDLFDFLHVQEYLQNVDISIHTTIGGKSFENGDESNRRLLISDVGIVANSLLLVRSMSS